MNPRNGNIAGPSAPLARHDRHPRNGHGSCALWFTGLSGAGKSTIAFALEKELHARNLACCVLDGDQLRQGLNRDLGFSREDRSENVRRAGEVAKLLVDAGLFVLAALISPSEHDRRMVKRLFHPDDFLEIYVRCSLEQCEKRDPKGLYRKARSGQIPDFTGIGSPYDVPASPDLVLDTERLSVEQCVAVLMRVLETRLRLSAPHGGGAR